MPSICNIAQRVCGIRGANIQLYRIVFRYACEKVETAFDNFNGAKSLWARLVALLDLSEGDSIRLTIRFSCGGQAAYDRDLRSLSIFKFCFDAS